MGEAQEAAARRHPDASPEKEERGESKPAGMSFQPKNPFVKAAPVLPGGIRDEMSVDWRQGWAGK
jgi:hypothetical protein